MGTRRTKYNNNFVPRLPELSDLVLDYTQDQGNSRASADR